eukprot:3666124-Rhodomonas_salina.1
MGGEDREGSRGRVGAESGGDGLLHAADEEPGVLLRAEEVDGGQDGKALDEQPEDHREGVQGQRLRREEQGVKAQARAEGCRG